MAVLAELDLQLFHFIVMEILLDQVALSLNPGPHVRGNIRNHPGHEELYQEDDMLPRKKAGQVGSTSAASAAEGAFTSENVCECGRVTVNLTMDWFYLHDDDERQLGSQNMPELHSAGVLLLVARRIAVITIPAKNNMSEIKFTADSYTGCDPLCKVKACNKV